MSGEPQALRHLYAQPEIEVLGRHGQGRRIWLEAKCADVVAKEVDCRLAVENSDAVDFAVTEPHPQEPQVVRCRRIQRVSHAVELRPRRRGEVKRRGRESSVRRALGHRPQSWDLIGAKFELRVSHSERREDLVVTHPID